jgi:hypothetical protein
MRGGRGLPPIAWITSCEAETMSFSPPMVVPRDHSADDSDQQHEQRDDVNVQRVGSAAAVGGGGGDAARYRTSTPWQLLRLKRERCGPPLSGARELRELHGRASCVAQTGEDRTAEVASVIATGPADHDGDYVSWAQSERWRPLASAATSPLHASIEAIGHALEKPGVRTVGFLRIELHLNATVR